MIGNHCQHVASTAIAKTGHPGIRPTVITPGTLIDEKFIDPSEHNFLLAVYLDVPSLQSQCEEIAS
jgi:DNA mismatch repair ATPase MutS